MILQQAVFFATCLLFPKTAKTFSNSLNFNGARPMNRISIFALSKRQIYQQSLGEISAQLPFFLSNFIECRSYLICVNCKPLSRADSNSMTRCHLFAVDLWDFFKLSQEYGGYDMVSDTSLCCNFVYLFSVLTIYS